MGETKVSMGIEKPVESIAQGKQPLQRGNRNGHFICRNGKSICRENAFV